ncbi:O-antigen ligase family protein [Fluviicola sp.]|uniref:O-antigen ligase family protein n=1 Tax=Fluviicola sp. TaxID=1917219 RepID=UPI0031D119BF
MKKLIPTLEKAQNWFPALLIFIFCFAPKPSSIVIILWLINNLVLWSQKAVKFQWNKIFSAITGLYLIFVIGSFFTHDPGIAGGILSKKLSLLVFPLIFALQNPRSFDLKPFVVAFLAGLIVVITLGFVHSYQFYLETEYLNGSFTGSVFSYIHHPTYLAVLLTMSIFFFRIAIWEQWKGFNTWTLLVWIAFISFIQFIIFSFAGVLFHFAVLAYLVVSYLKKKLPAMAFLVVLAIIASLPFVAYFGVTRVKDEVNNTLTDLKIYLSDPDHIYEQAKLAPHGNNIRILMWTTSFQQFSEHPMGTGTGNFDEVMGARLRAKGLDEIAKVEYNSHNQFLQLAVEVGIFGLLCFVMLLFLVFRMGIRYRNELLVWIGLNLVFNGFFESMLQQQSGIVFYVLTICIGILLVRKKHPLRTAS